MSFSSSRSNSDSTYSTHSIASSQLLLSKVQLLRPFFKRITVSYDKLITESVFIKLERFTECTFTLESADLYTMLVESRVFEIHRLKNYMGDITESKELKHVTSSELERRAHIIKNNISNPSKSLFCPTDAYIKYFSTRGNFVVTRSFPLYEDFSYEDMEEPMLTAKLSLSFVNFLLTLKNTTVLDFIVEEEKITVKSSEKTDIIRITATFNIQVLKGTRERFSINRKHLNTLALLQNNSILCVLHKSIMFYALEKDSTTIIKVKKYA